MPQNLPDLSQFRSGCGMIFGFFVIFALAFLIVQPFQDKIIDLLALLINAFILSNLFLFNILVILVLLVLIFIVLYVYSKL